MTPSPAITMGETHLPRPASLDAHREALARYHAAVLIKDQAAALASALLPSTSPDMKAATKAMARKLSRDLQELRGRL